VYDYIEVIEVLQTAGMYKTSTHCVLHFLDQH